MRPRRARLGCDPGGETRDAQTSRFNEAEARAPRMRSCRRRGCAPPGRFNEAEARAPRMPVRAPSRSPTISTSFNEAEARAPRMRGRAVGVHRRLHGASMRPRRARLGCRRRRSRCPRVFSRGFNEAEARAPRMPGEVDQERRLSDRASMRPRRARLGCTASPGKAFRGEPRFNEAEARAPRMPDRALLPGVRVSNRFNEAEARAPRMPSSIVTAAFDHPASMRPRRARLGCLISGRMQPERASGFNEAEARAPRMRGSRRGLRLVRAGHASMRPRRARLGCGRHRRPRRRLSRMLQ